MNKRKQRSTQIRKRIEKKQREENKARRKEARAGGGGDDMVAFSLPRERAASCAKALADLGLRLSRQSLRGWTTADLEGENGLAWLMKQLAAAATSGGGDDVRVEIPEAAKHAILDRMSSFELASSGLQVAWEEAGFDELVRAIHSANAEDEDDVDEPEPAAASGDATTTASGDETPAAEDGAPAEPSES
jgi:hypothetical protein